MRNTSKNYVVLIFLFFLIGCPLESKEKNRDWKIGVLTNVESNDQGAIATSVGTAVVAIPIHEWTYEVQTESMTYIFARKAVKPLNLTVNGKMKFALDKAAKAFVLDDDGKEFQVSIIRKIAKNAEK